MTKKKKNIYEKIFKGNNKLNKEDLELYEKIWSEASSIFEKSYSDIKEIFKHFNTSDHTFIKKVDKAEAMIYLIVNSRLSAALIANTLASNITSQINLSMEEIADTIIVNAFNIFENWAKENLEKENNIIN